MYGIGAVAFVGGSLVEKGGHNPLEPAQFGVPVVMGESYFNFREIVGALREADAIRLVRKDELGAAMVELLAGGGKAMGQTGAGGVCGAGGGDWTDGGGVGWAGGGWAMRGWLRPLGAALSRWGWR